MYPIGEFEVVNKSSGGDAMTFLIILLAGGFFGLSSSAMLTSEHDSVSFVSLFIFVACIAIAVIALLNLIGSTIS
jgi:hypothetical protein